MCKVVENGSTACPASWLRFSAPVSQTSGIEFVGTRVWTFNDKERDAF